MGTGSRASFSALVFVALPPLGLGLAAALGAELGGGVLTLPVEPLWSSLLTTCLLGCVFCAVGGVGAAFMAPAEPGADSGADFAAPAEPDADSGADFAAPAGWFDAALLPLPPPNHELTVWLSPPSQLLAAWVAPFFAWLASVPTL